MQRRVKPGRPIQWAKAEQKDMSIVSLADIALAKNLFRKLAPVGLDTLLNAKATKVKQK